MAASTPSRPFILLAILLVLLVLPGQAAAFGAGNIPSIAQVEGHNWRHGDIEDMLKTVAFLHGKKWTSLMVSRVYFGNWLRDYSQAVDVGSLKAINKETIRVLVWVLSFLAHGYATGEFEVTEERLGVYRPEEHIDNPLGYADGKDARESDPRLRGPIDPRETQIDMRTGMKNYIANEDGGWATSTAYIRYSLARCIHFGRLYTNGARGTAKREADLCEGLRCLGQALHCLEDFSAHSNYCELVLRELGYSQAFPHCGSATKIRLRGKHVYPLVTGTFGAVDFLHSVLGEATDHFTQSEVDEMNVVLKNAEELSCGGNIGSINRRLFGGPSRSGSASAGDDDFVSLISRIPGIGDSLASHARSLKDMSSTQERDNISAYRSASTRNNSPDRHRADPIEIPGMSPNFDAAATAKKIYPILEFRDRVVKSINRIVSKIPGLEKLIERISETLTAFILGLLAPYIRPIISQVSKALKQGSSSVITASARLQLEPWRDPTCSDPTHSMLSKDHFTNILNPCAGRVAATILQYTVPRVMYAWEHTGVPVDEVVDDVLRALHHPAIRDDSVQIQRDMFETVRSWMRESPYRHRLNDLLSSESVKNGKNHILPEGQQTTRSTGHTHSGCHGDFGSLGHGKVAGSLWEQIRSRDLQAMEDDATPFSPTSDPPSSPFPTSGSFGQANSGSMDQPTSWSSPYGYHVNQPSPEGYAQQFSDPRYTWSPPGPNAFSSGSSGPPQGYYGQPYMSPYGQQQPPWLPPGNFYGQSSSYQPAQPPYPYPTEGQPPPPHGSYDQPPYPTNQPHYQPPYPVGDPSQSRPPEQHGWGDNPPY